MKTICTTFNAREGRLLRRIVGQVAAVGAVLLVSVAPAGAQEVTEEECYPLPLEQCVDVGGVREERPPQPAPDSDVEDAPEPAPDEVAVAPDQLPRTGTDTGIALAAALGLIGIGGYAVRRSRADRA